MFMWQKYITKVILVCLIGVFRPVSAGNSCLCFEKLYIILYIII